MVNNMSITITKTYEQAFPALRFIGKKYTDADRVNGVFGAKWGEWWQKGYFDALEKHAEHIGLSLQSIANDDGYIGLCHCDGSAFSYWIGIFFPEGASVPEGFAYLDLPKHRVGVAWVHGNEDNGEIYGRDTWDKAFADVTKLLYKEDNAPSCETVAVSFERYNCPRYTGKDEQGNVTLDYGFYLPD